MEYYALFIVGWGIVGIFRIFGKVYFLKFQSLTLQFNNFYNLLRRFTIYVVLKYVTCYIKFKQSVSSTRCFSSLSLLTSFFVKKIFIAKGRDIIFCS